MDEDELDEFEKRVSEMASFISTFN